ncbi:hypothetical protein PIB30_030801 [Stylosanthes scabra]|uniref:Uncharacterized protein n=1 Tax=Stylosanthes scabra TaxID=79078 RepID=A0ABU6QB51_9FABA|nr:hypothetical protein [Stylosanthes scabra]
MELKASAFGGKGFRVLKYLNGKKSATTNSSRIHVLEEDRGVVRMKLVLRKSELKQLLEFINNNGGVNKGAANHDHRTMSSSSSLTAEQRLNHLLVRKKKKHVSYRIKSRCSNESYYRSKCWSPALQSIPEE